MTEPNSGERLLELLRSALLHQRISSPEMGEGNLRRLVRAAVSPPVASERLRRRVWSLIVAHQMRPPSWLSRVLPWLRARELTTEQREQERIDAGLTPRQHELLGLLLAPNTGPLPETIVAHRESQQAIGAVLESLPPPEREALLMHMVDDLPVEEIARVTRRSISQTLYLLQRAQLAILRLGQRGLCGHSLSCQG